MNNRNPHQIEDAHYRILRLLEARPEVSQRELARQLGVSLGVVNYCIQALVEKGILKMAHFAESRNKRGYAYLFTPQGVVEKLAMTRRFLARKQTEYAEIKAEIDQAHAEMTRNGEAAKLG